MAFSYIKSYNGKHWMDTDRKGNVEILTSAKAKVTGILQVGRKHASAESINYQERPS